jgi:hypothetical protein
VVGAEASAPNPFTLEEVPVQPRISKAISATALATVLLWTGAALAAPTLQQACRGAKNKAAGNYATCRQGAEAKLATTGNVAKYTAALATCGNKFIAAWQKAIVKALLKNATCLDDPLTASDFQAAIAAHTDNVASALSGLGLQANGAARLKTGQTTCYDAAGTTIACPGTGQDGELQKGLARRYTDNGDGTITDTKTGLMWEKLSDDGSIHDKDTTHTWANAFASKIATLNSSSFADHSDWRLPNVNELQSLVQYGAVAPSVDAAFTTACAASCTVTTCSCTQSNLYWSATTFQFSPSDAWGVLFLSGHVSPTLKSNTFFVRAVRAGS